MATLSAHACCPSPPSHSGKSTYLKQVALITILAHCGSYVPASEASIPIRDQICTRIGSADDQEHNISSFLREMKETAMICNNTTERSLFLLDELGRATSNEDGVAIAWAVSEFLLTKRAMTFFVTHHPQISKLAEVYPNVQVERSLSSSFLGNSLTRVSFRASSTESASWFPDYNEWRRFKYQVYPQNNARSLPFRVGLRS